MPSVCARAAGRRAARADSSSTGPAKRPIGSPYDIAWVQRSGVARRHDQRFRRGLHGSARRQGRAGRRSSTIVNEEKTRKIQTLAAMRSGSKITCRAIRDTGRRSVLGITAKAIEVIVETGDSGPLTPIGINLPNDQAIRERYGSKSVSLFNVNEAYEESTPEGDARPSSRGRPEEAARAKKWGAFSQELTTEMHEVIGHGSGRMADGVASPHLLLKEQCFGASRNRVRTSSRCTSWPIRSSSELGIVSRRGPRRDRSDARSSTTRGTRSCSSRRDSRRARTIEEDHMRNRQMIVGWLIAHTTAIDVPDARGQDVLRHDRRRRRSARARAPARRGAADQERGRLRGREDAVRYATESISIRRFATRSSRASTRSSCRPTPRSSMPRLTPRYRDGEIVDVEISYPCDLETQMLEYSAFARSADASRDALPPHADLNALTRALTRPARRGRGRLSI